MSDLQLTVTSIREAAEDWDDLADRLGASPFTRPGWASCWHDAFGGPEPSILLARSQSRLVGVLPLQERWGMVHSPTNWNSFEFGWLAETPSVARRLVAAAVERARWQVQLEYLNDEEAALFARTVARLGWSGADYVMQSSPYIQLSGSFEDYRGSLSRNTRKQLNRKRREVAGLGTLSFEVSSEFDDEAFAAFLALEGSGWKEEQGSAIAENPQELRLYRESARWAASRGWLRLGLLRLDGEPIAGDLAFECQGAHLVLKTGYAPTWEDLSPGRLLREDSIRRAFEQGLDTYEFLGSDARWKRSWCVDAHCRHRVAAFRKGWTGRALRVVHVRGRPLVRDAIHQWRNWRGRR